MGRSEPAESEPGEGMEYPPAWEEVSEDPAPVPKKPDAGVSADPKKEEPAPAWPTVPEDPVHQTAPPPGKCPCFIRLRFVKIDGGSTAQILNLLAQFFIDNPLGKNLYHAALEVQVPEKPECPIYVVELNDFISDPDEALRKGQLLRGDASVNPSGLGSDAYGIRKWRNGTVEDGQDPAVAHAGRRILSTDCNTARRLLDLVGSIPTNNYSPTWTSNSIVAWLLEKVGLNPAGLDPPVHGLVPSWEHGITEAGQ